MRVHQHHPWDLKPKQAAQLQRELSDKVVRKHLPEEDIRWVGGVDVGFPHGRQVGRASVVVLDYLTLEIVDQALAEVPTSFPYIPGLLSFREMPPILAALRGLGTQPDVFITDGHGLAHPRRFGLACHLGVLLERPTVGCAKSILVGEHNPLDEARGSTAPLVDGNETIGMAVRTRDGVRPVFVSLGHRIDLVSAVRVVLACSRRYRLPEPIRQAHRLASRKGSPENQPG